MNASLWKVYLYELQLEAPTPKRIVCGKDHLLKPSYYGREFHGKVTRGEADKLLSAEEESNNHKIGNGKTDGRYLVRESIRSPGQYTLCLRFNHVTKNYRLHFFDGKHFFGDRPNDDKKFDTLHDLVADVLISLYLELHAGDYIAGLGTECTYEESPYMTLHMTLHKKHRQRNVGSKVPPPVGPKPRILGQHGLPPTTGHGHKNTHMTASSSGSSSSGGSRPSRSKMSNRQHGGLGQQTPVKKRYGLESLRISEYDEDDQYLVEEGDVDPNFLFHQNTLDGPLASMDIQLLEKAHVFKVHNFLGLPFCDFCGNFMWGIMGQGVRCEDCGFSAHKKCSEKIPPDCCPDLSHIRRIFGVDLTTLVKACNTIRPFVLDACVKEIEHRGLHVEGLYRVSGFADDVEYLKVRLEAEGTDGDDSSIDYVLRSCDDVHVITGVLKMYFRLLPIPVITFESYPLFVAAIKKATEFDKLSAIRDAIGKLPPAHFQTLKFFLNHLVRVASFSDDNLMTPYNLGMVFAPTLMRQPTTYTSLSSSGGGSAGQSSGVSKYPIVTPWQLDVEVVETLINYYSKLFK